MTLKKKKWFTAIFYLKSENPMVVILATNQTETSK